MAVHASATSQAASLVAGPASGANIAGGSPEPRVQSVPPDLISLSELVWHTLPAHARGRETQKPGNVGPADGTQANGGANSPDYRLPTREELSKDLKAQFDKSFTVEQKSDAWKEAAEIVQKYSDEMVEQWNKAIDSLLTFAGLFSAILTAFNVQSYQLLQPAPTDETTAILVQISAQLASFTVNPSFLNSSEPAYNATSAATNDQFQAPTYAIWLNTLWFASLVFSVSSATIGIIAKQWLSEFTAGLFGTSRETARRRQYRLNKLLEWNVPGIVASLPVLLLLALVFFLAGLLILLYNVHRTVFTATTTLAAVLLAFLFFTTILPAFSSSCCYHSPQSYAATAILRAVPHVVSALVATAGITIWTLVLLPLQYVLYPFKWWRKLVPKIGFVILENFRAVFGWILTHWRALVKESGLGERVALSGAPGSLDIDTLVKAYCTPLDVRRLESVELCLADVGEEQATDEYVTLFSGFLWGQPLDPRNVAQVWIRDAIQAFLLPTTAEQWEEAHKKFMRVPYFRNMDLLAFVSSSSELNLKIWPAYHAWLLLYTRIALEGFPDGAKGLMFQKAIAAAANALTTSAKNYERMRLVSVQSGRIALGSYVGALGLCLQSISKYTPDPSIEGLYRAVCVDVRAELARFHRLATAPPVRPSRRHEIGGFDPITSRLHFYASYKMLGDGIASVINHRDAGVRIAICSNAVQLVEDLGKVFAAFVGSETLHLDVDFAGACRVQLRVLREKVGLSRPEPPVAASS